MTAVSWDPSTGETSSGRPRDQGEDWYPAFPGYPDPEVRPPAPALDQHGDAVRAEFGPAPG